MSKIFNLGQKSLKFFHTVDKIQKVYRLNGLGTSVAIKQSTFVSHCDIPHIVNDMRLNLVKLKLHKSSKEASVNLRSKSIDREQCKYSRLMYIQKWMVGPDKVMMI